MSTVRLAHDVHGPTGGEFVVLGSSLGTTRTMWDEQLPLLAEHFRVVRYDHRGHGESPVPDGPYTMPRLAADVLALLDDLGVQRASHIGLSLGGMVAMQLASTRPDRVERLGLVCTSAHMPPEPWRQRAATVRAEGMDAVADAVSGRWFTDGFAGTARAAELADALRTTSPEGYAGCCDAIGEMDLRPQLSDVRAPTLVIAGADDPATPPEHAHRIADGIRSVGGGASVVVLDGAAHLAGVEHAEAVGHLLLEHLEASPWTT